MTSQYLILSADDLGLHVACNRGILKAARDGLLTSASLCANGFAFNEAVNEVIPACPNLGIGAHLCLNEGFACVDPGLNPRLTAIDGKFRYQGVRGFLRFAMGGDKKLRAEVTAEIRTQIEKILTATHCDHLDGHMHTHVIPWIFEIVLELAAEYKIPYVRVPEERANFGAFLRHFPHLLNFGHWLNLQNYCRGARKKLAKTAVRANDYFYGLMHSNAMNEEIATYLLKKHHSRGGVIEMLFHPAIVANDDTEPLDALPRAWMASPSRDQELSALLSDNLRAAILRQNFKLTNYGTIAREW